MRQKGKLFQLRSQRLSEVDFLNGDKCRTLIKLAGEEMQREVGSSPIGSQELLIELMDYSVIGLNVLRAFR